MATVRVVRRPRMVSATRGAGDLTSTRHASHSCATPRVRNTYNKISNKIIIYLLQQTNGPLLDKGLSFQGGTTLVRRVGKGFVLIFPSYYNDVVLRSVLPQRADTTPIE